MKLYSTSYVHRLPVLVSPTENEVLLFCVTSPLVFLSLATTAFQLCGAVIKRFKIHGEYCRAQIEVGARKDALYDSLRSGLIIIQERRKADVRPPTIIAPDKELTPLTISPQNLPASKEVLDALYSIETTPYCNSFLSRLRGFRGFVPPGLVAVDWEIRTPWMNVMADIREHYLFAQFV